MEIVSNLRGSSFNHKTKQNKMNVVQNSNELTTSRLDTLPSLADPDAIVINILISEVKMAFSPGAVLIHQ